MTGWFWETDAALRFTYFSPSVEGITGVPAEWRYGKTREDFGLPESVRPEDWEAHHYCLRRREPFTDFVFQRRGPDGVRWMRTSGKPVFDDFGSFQGGRGTASVITEEIEANQRGESLTAAIDNHDKLFVLWGPDDRLVSATRNSAISTPRSLTASSPAGCSKIISALPWQRGCIRPPKAGRKNGYKTAWPGTATPARRSRCSARTAVGSCWRNNVCPMVPSPLFPSISPNGNGPNRSVATERWHLPDQNLNACLD